MSVYVGPGTPCGWQVLPRSITTGLFLNGLTILIHVYYSRQAEANVAATSETKLHIEKRPQQGAKDLLREEDLSF